MSSLTQYWQKALASITKPFNPRPQQVPRLEELERGISAVTSENRTLSAELSRIRTDFEQTRSEEKLKIAMLERVHEEIGGLLNQDRGKLDKLERLGTELDKARTADVQRFTRLERWVGEIESESRQAWEKAGTLEGSLSETSARLETTDRQVSALEDRSAEQAKAFDASLAQAVTCIGDTQEHIKSVEKQLKDKHRVVSGALEKIQGLQRRQVQRFNWGIAAAGFALLLGAVAGAILVRDVQTNTRVLAGMNGDIQALVTSFNQQLAMQHDFPDPQPPVLPPATVAPILTEPVPPPEPISPPETASPPVSETLAAPVPPWDKEPVPAGKRDVNRYFLGRDLDLFRQMYKEGAPNVIRQESNNFPDVNIKQEIVIQTQSGLRYQVVTAGTGKTPTMSDKVMLNYLGTTVAGTVFVDTYSAGTPVTYNMSDLIAGWQEALLKMQEGAEWGLYVPPQLAQVRAATKPHTSVLEPGFYLIKLLKVIEG